MSLKHRSQAWGALIQRYAQTFRHFWSLRHQMETGLFRAEEAEFLPAALAVQETPPSKTARLLAWILIALVLAALLWALLGKMDIIVNAPGKIIPSQRIKTIASIETASIRKLEVEDGQTVKAGQTLLELDTSVLQTEHDKALGDRNQAVLALARNQALLLALDQHTSPVLPSITALKHEYQADLDAEKWQAAALHVQGQYADFSAKYKKLGDDLRHYSQTLPLATQQEKAYRELSANNDVSKDAWLEKQRNRMQLQAQLAEAKNQQASLLAETRKTALDQMAEARRVAAASAQDALKAASTSKLLILKSPVDGTVQQLNAHTVGGVVQAAQPIMQIVPHGGPVEVEAFIENKDKGFVHAGQKVEVKVDTFEYTKYGTLPGKVTHVSQDAIPDEKRGLLYAVKVLLDKSILDINGQPTPVTPGMAVNVEVKTGDRRVIEYVLSPLLRYTHEAGAER